MNMKADIKRPFELAQIEIYKLCDFDIVTASPTGPDPFEGEEDEFETYYWER